MRAGGGVRSALGAGAAQRVALDFRAHSVKAFGGGNLTVVMGNSFHTDRNQHRRATPIFAVLVSVLCLVGQVLTAAHEATERHVRCSEHGEMSHLRVASVAPAARLEAAGTVEGQVVGEASSHDHCAILVVSQRPQGRPILVVSPAPAVAPRPEPGPSPLLASQTERILLSAPKIAPPSC